MIPTPPPTRTETMIALRARREAKQFADRIAYPTLLPPPPPFPTPRSIRLCVPLYFYGGEIVLHVPLDLSAPRWMIWLLTGCIAAIAAATILIFKITR